MAVSKIDLTRQATNSGSVSFNSQKITNLLDPTLAQDGATKAYVDSTTAGLSWKAAVRAATTAPGTLATSFANASVIDGVTLATGDRILIKNQATASENGLYVVQASGNPTRSTDANSSANFVDNTAVFVEEGTTLADSAWTLTNNGVITVGTTALVFSQFAGTGGTGTVTSVSVTTANGFAGSVTNPTTTPAITISTNVTGLLKGNGTAISAAVAGTDYVVPTAFVDKEIPTGAINGANTTYTLANTPIAGSEHVYLNGILQESGAGNDYTISTNTITYLAAPLTGDKLRVTYRK
jgi:hypothetical protein